MPKSRSVNDYFARIEEIKGSDIARWLGGKTGNTILENKLGNKILYPETIPETQSDLNFDLAILRGIIEISKENFYNNKTCRIEIPEQLILKYGDIQKIIWAVIESIKPKNVTTLWKRSENFTLTSLGSLISPEIIADNCFITFQINKKQYQIKGGSTILIPAPESKVNLIFSATGAKLIGKQLVNIQVPGGELGIIVDARINK